jgi:hypothetical protein
MPHFAEEYADAVNAILHQTHGVTRFYKQEIIEIPGLLVSLLITYDGVRDDERLVTESATWNEFLGRMARVKADWATFDRKVMEKLTEYPDKTMLGYEGRTIYFIKPGSDPDQWTREKAAEDAIPLLKGSLAAWGPLIAEEIRTLPERIKPGREHFSQYEHLVRVVFNFLFHFLGPLGEGQAQSRTADEDEGVEIRDIIFANKADAGFWKDKKDKWSASEIVVDAKNKTELSRNDLRQLYCYLKPVLGYFGVIVCRKDPDETIRAFNRTLIKNFRQERVVLILSDDDLRRMVDIALRGGNPSEYLQEQMSELLRSI